MPPTSIEVGHAIRTGGCWIRTATAVARSTYCTTMRPLMISLVGPGIPAPGDDLPPACGSALPAAQTALAALKAAPQEIQQHIFIDIALHYGDAAYGNIGSGNRLDFTAVGRDVNILSRLELLCKDVGRPLLMTDAFAVEVAEPVIEIGHFELRGFRGRHAVYALCREGEQPCCPKSSFSCDTPAVGGSDDGTTPANL